MLEYSWYEMPTSCVPPIIVIDNKFVDSGILKRHPLSAIFGDMPDKDYQSLVKSVQNDGFIDDVIRLYEGQILDGWHRYCASRELNLLRKLKFQEWHEDEHRDGDPKVFVLARNIERRHLSAQQRAQIVVSFNERFEKGDIDSQRDGTPNGEPKTRGELAKEAGVGTSTIDRAVAVEKEGESEAVIAGEKTAGEVIKARDANRLKKVKKHVLKNMWDTRIQAARDYTGEADTDLNQYLTLPELEMGFIRNNESYAEAFGSGMQRIDRAHNFKDFQDRAFEVDEFGNAKVDVEDLEKEYRAILTYSGDIRQWKREDWSPDTNWILPLIEAKKKAKASDDTAEKLGKVSERDELKTLREQIKTEMPKWKQRYKESGKKESELVSRASFSALIHVLRNWEEASGASPEEKAATAEELKELLKFLKDDSYVFIYRLRDYIRDTAQPVSEARHHMSVSPGDDAGVVAVSDTETTGADDEPTDSDEDTSLTEIDNLPAVKHFLESLLKQVGQVKHPIDRDNLSVAVFDLLCGEEFEGTTEQEQLSILIDCAYTLVAESM